MKWKTMFVTSVCSLAVLTAPVASAFAADPTQTNVDTLTEVYKLLVRDHFSHPDQDKVLDGAIQGMLSTLNDPFTDYFTPAEYQSFTDTINQQYAGIGVAIQSTADGKVVIGTVYPDSPAEKAGLKAGDQITAIDHTQLTSADPDAVSAKIRGAAGSSVVLTLVRGTSAPQDYSLTRQPINLPTVQSIPDIGDGVAYVRIYSFGETTGAEFTKALNALQQQTKPPTGLVLDLRDNGGGYVQSALQIADDLMQSGTIIVVHDDQGNPEAIQANGQGKGTTLPLAVLVNKNTASASEMLSSALQKNGRAKVIGEQTFGKGTMQTPNELPNGGYLKVSIDQWDMADGKTLDHVGLTPDIALTHHDLDLNAAMQQLEPQRAETLTYSVADSTATLNGNPLQNVPDFLLPGKEPYLPLRYTIEALGSEVDWSAQDQTASFNWHGHAVKANVQTSSLTIDGSPSLLASPLKLIHGNVYLSADALNQITGGTVDVTPQNITIHTH